MYIEEFLNNEVVDFANYNCLRSIASLIDGQKNAGRKVIYGVANRPNKETKVSILSGLIMIATEYLHGDISGSIISMAQNFSGTNNMNLLVPDGNFGTRFIPEASATRYISTYRENIFDKLFNQIDNNILIEQEFEGTIIEPRFFVPSLPLILINGSEGIATGFAQKILPRNPEVIKDYVKSYLTPNSSLPELTPWFRGFDGAVEKGENDNQWLIKGSFTKTSATRLVINELPIGYNLTSYTKILDDLEDKKVIRSYEDLSEDDIFKFEVVMNSKDLKRDDEYILLKLKLVKKATENFTVIDENNKVTVYNSPEEVINHYIRIKLEYLQKRKDYLIEKTKQDLLVLASKYIFIKNVTEENIKINKVKKTDIIAQIETFNKIIKVDNSYDYLLNMKIFSLTLEKLDDLLEQTKNKKIDLSNIESKEINDTWNEEMDLIC